MPPRFRTSIVLAFALVTVYLVFWRGLLWDDESQSHSVDVLSGNLGNLLVGGGSEEDGVFFEPPPDGVPRPPSTTKEPQALISNIYAIESTSTKSAEAVAATGEGEVADKEWSLQEQFQKEYKALGM